MAVYRGFLEDEGPFSFYNVMRAMTIMGAIGSILMVWTLTPWWPWR